MSSSSTRSGLPVTAPIEMSSSVLPAALKRRRMGLAEGLDIGSLLCYDFLSLGESLEAQSGDRLWKVGRSFSDMVANFQTPNFPTTNQVSEPV